MMKSALAIFAKNQLTTPASVTILNAVRPKNIGTVRAWSARQLRAIAAARTLVPNPRPMIEPLQAL